MTTDEYLIERSEERQRQELAALLLAARARMETPQFTEPRFAAFDGKHCFDCHDELPQVRLLLGRVRCVRCQTRAERQGAGA